MILVCLARSSAELTAVSICCAVRKAARLAVYDEIMMRVKNHQMEATMRVGMALKRGQGKINHVHFLTTG